MDQQMSKQEPKIIYFVTTVSQYGPSKTLCALDLLLTLEARTEREDPGD